MNSVLISAAVTLFALTGCACDRHPMACWAGAVIVAGSVAACSNHRTDSGHIPTPDVNCVSGACR